MTPDHWTVSLRRLALAATMVTALAAPALARDVSQQIARYDYRADRREMSRLLHRRDEAAAGAMQLVSSFKSESPVEAVSTRLSSGATLTSTPIARNSVGGDRVREKALERAAFESRPPRINDPGIHMDRPDALRVLTEPLAQIAGSAAVAYPYYFYYQHHHNGHR